MAERIIFNISDFCIFIGAFLSVVGSEAHHDTGDLPEDDRVFFTG